MPELRQRSKRSRGRHSAAAVLAATLLAAGLQPRASTGGRDSDIPSLFDTIPSLQIPDIPGLAPEFVYYDQVWEAQSVQRGPHLNLISGGGPK